MNPPLIHITYADGHRSSYRNLLVRLLNGTPSTGPIRGARFWLLSRADKVFFATIDDDYLGFIFIAILRTIQRKPTTGLFLRAAQCFRTERPIIYPLKRHVFRWLCKLPKLRLLSIIPHDIRPELAEVSHDWIYDPQLWDLWLDGPPQLPDTKLSKRVESERGVRKVMIFIGSGNRIKGFPEFVAQVEKDKQKTLAVVAGRVNPEYKILSDRLKQCSMIVEDRFVTDEEILSLYNVADFAWCRYAADYDQASGVFGRALQTGVTPIFRTSSIIENLYDRLSDRPIDEAMRDSMMRIKKNYFL